MSTGIMKFSIMSLGEIMTTNLVLQVNLIAERKV